MKRTAHDYAVGLSRSLASIDAAIAAGTHSPQSRFYCTGCGREVDAIYYAVGKVRLCKTCDPTRPLQQQVQQQGGQLS